MTIGAKIIIGNAIIWGFVMIACSFLLKGTESFILISSTLSGGAGVTLLLNAVMAMQIKKEREAASGNMKQEEEKEEV